MKSKNWDTRIAAAQAVEAVACNVPKWNPDGVKVKEEGKQMSIFLAFIQGSIALVIISCLERQNGRDNF